MKFTIESKASCLEAFNLLNSNKGKGLIIIGNKKAIGFVTDGDIRRFLISGGEIKDNVELAMKKEFIKFSKIPTYLEAIEFLDRGIKILPIISNNDEFIDLIDLNDISKIPIHDPRLVGNELKYLTECIETNWISSQGSYVDKFEQLFSEIHNNIPASTTSSGTTSLELAFKTIKSRKNGYVLVPDLTFGATLNAVINSGLTPLICPIKKDDFSIDLSNISESILSETAAICVVHLYGSIVDMSSIFELRKKYNFYIVEDCAEALGSKINGQRAGTFGDFSAFSFFGNKLITTGEGGMILCKNDELFEYFNLIKNHGMSKNKKYWHEVVGTNARMTNIQAAIGLGQLENLEKVVKKKREIHSDYFKKLSCLEDKLVMWHESTNVQSSYWLNTINLKKDIYINNLLSNGKKMNIDFRRCFYPMNSLPAFRKYANRNSDYNHSTLLFNQLICLPSGLNLSVEKISKVIQVIEKSIK